MPMSLGFHGDDLPCLRKGGYYLSHHFDGHQAAGYDNEGLPRTLAPMDLVIHVEPIYCGETAPTVTLVAIGTSRVGAALVQSVHARCHCDTSNMLLYPAPQQASRLLA